MFYKFDKNVEILNPQLFKDKIVYIPENLSSKTNSKDIAEFLVFCKSFGITFNKDSNFSEFMNNASPEVFQRLKLSLSPKVGATFFNLKRDYGLEEFIRTITEYLKSYNNFTEIPDELFINFPKIDNVKVDKEYSFVKPNLYFEKLENIINSTKNPTSEDYMFLCNTIYLELLEIDNYILNRNVLKILAEIPNFKFKAKDTAQLREFYTSLKKIRTSNKNFIMRTLNSFRECEVLSDFNANKEFWKKVEHNLKPTQKKYSKYPNSQRFFKLLRNNEFKNSSNSIIENSFNLTTLESFYKLASKLKSKQYAIRNITKHLKRNGFKSNNVNSLLNYIENDDIKIKVLIELYRGLLNQTPERVFKIKNKFWISQDNKTYNFNYITNKLKDIILKKIKLKALEFVKSENNELEIPPVSRSIEGLKRVPMPTGTDNFFRIDKSKGYFTRGTKLKLSDYVNDDYIVFIAWRKKDFKRGEIDLDLSGVEVKNDDLENLDFETCHFINLNSTNMKHSGDFTFCKEFDPKTGLITCESIAVKKEANNLHFCLNTYNDVSLKDLDIFAGICDAKDYKEKQKTGILNIENAKILFEISQDFTGFYKLFSIKDGYLMLEGVNFGKGPFYSIYKEIIGMIGSSKYIETLHCFNMYDFVKDLGIEVYNPYKLEMLMDYVINS